MTDEEYLRAKGWRDPEIEGAGWTHASAPRGEGGQFELPMAEAVEAQLAEDRACLEYVFARSDITIITRERDSEGPFRHTVDTDVVGIRLGPK
jgi:hypothetical protein